MKDPGYLKPEDEVPNSRKFAIKALKKKLSQKDLGMRKALIEERGMQLPGILEQPVIGQPKAKSVMSGSVKAGMRGSRPYAALKDGGLGDFLADMTHPQKLLLAGAVVAGLYYYREQIADKLGISL